MKSMIDDPLEISSFGYPKEGLGGSSSFPLLWLLLNMLKGKSIQKQNLQILPVSNEIGRLKNVAGKINIYARWWNDFSDLGKWKCQ